MYNNSVSADVNSLYMLPFSRMWNFLGVDEPGLGEYDSVCQASISRSNHKLQISGQFHPHFGMFIFGEVNREEAQLWARATCSYNMYLSEKVPVSIHDGFCFFFRATSHTSQEPWPWNCESPKEKCPKATVPTNTPPKSCNVVMDPQVYCVKPGSHPNAISMDFYSSGLSHMIR